MQPPSSAHPGKPNPARLRNGALAAVVGLLLVAIAVKLVRPHSGVSDPIITSPAESSTSVAALTNEEEATLQRAYNLFTTADYMVAHDTLQAIAPTSAARQDPRFEKVEAAWLGEIYNAALHDEPAKKRDILKMITENPFSHESLRTQAIQELSRMDDDEVLQEAETLFKKDNLETAHQKLHQLSQGSLLDRDPRVKAIEDAWTKERFRQSKEAKTEDEKRTILEEIVADPWVSPDDRKKAGWFLAGIDPSAQEEKDSPEQDTSAESPEDDFAVPSTSSTSRIISIYAAKRRGLEPKVWGGKASVEEIQLLREICWQMRDKKCFDRATGLLKKTKN